MASASIPATGEVAAQPGAEPSSAPAGLPGASAAPARVLPASFQSAPPTHVQTSRGHFNAGAQPQSNQRPQAQAAHVPSQPHPLTHLMQPEALRQLSAADASLRIAGNSTIPAMGSSTAGYPAMISLPGAGALPAGQRGGASAIDGLPNVVRPPLPRSSIDLTADSDEDLPRAAGQAARGQAARLLPLSFQQGEICSPKQQLVLLYLIWHSFHRLPSFSTILLSPHFPHAMCST